jgi:hypothetical protein
MKIIKHWSIAPIMKDLCPDGLWDITDDMELVVTSTEYNVTPTNLNNAIKIEEVKEVQEVANQEARQYLASTDWFLLRELDGGTTMTAEMKQLRAAARTKVI